VAKFAHDFVMDPANTHDTERYGNAVYLPYVCPSILVVVKRFLIVLSSGTFLNRSGEINPLRAKILKVRLYQRIFKYKHGGNVGTRPSLLRGSVVATYEKDTDTEQWEKDIKDALEFSFETLRDKLTLYMRLPLWVFSP